MFINYDSFRSHLQHFRRYSVHFLFLLFIIIYAFGGGLIFYKLESDASKSYWNGQIAKTNLCIVQVNLYSDFLFKYINFGTVK